MTQWDWITMYGLCFLLSRNSTFDSAGGLERKSPLQYGSCEGCPSQVRPNAWDLIYGHHRHMVTKSLAFPGLRDLFPWGKYTMREPLELVKPLTPPCCNHLVAGRVWAVFGHGDGVKGALCSIAAAGDATARQDPVLGTRMMDTVAT